MSTRAVRTLGALLMLCAGPGAARAQDRPFVFSLTTAGEVSKPQVRMDYDVGLGEQTFRSGAADGAEHHLGVQASLKRWTLVGRFGFSAPGAAKTSYATSQQGEVLYSILTQRSPVSLAAGGGLLHEAGGANVLLARAVAGREATRWRLHGNFLLQKPFVEGRDAIDVITSAGWAWRAGRSVSLGLEAIGEDLEGFWEAEEAEGGARLLAGPSLHLAPPGRAWQLSVVGGPMFHPSRTGLSSDALRDLPPDTGARGYAFKVSFSGSF